MGYTNHACDPSVAVEVESDGRVVMTARRDVQEGEEITMSYTALDASFEERQQTLKEHYHFTCSCPRCLKEGGGQVKNRLQKKLDKKSHGGCGGGEVLSEEEIAKRQKEADRKMAELLAEEEGGGGKKKKKKK